MGRIHDLRHTFVCRRLMLWLDLHRFRSGQVLMLSGPLFEGQG